MAGIEVQEPLMMKASVLISFSRKKKGERATSGQ